MKFARKLLLSIPLATLCIAPPADACDACARAMVVYYMPWHAPVLGVAVAWHLRAAALCGRAAIEPARMFRGKGSVAFVVVCLLAQITGTTSVLSIPALLLGPLLLWRRSGAADFPEAWRRPFRTMSRAFSGACILGVVAGYVFLPVSRVEMLTTRGFAGTGPGHMLLNGMIRETPPPRDGADRGPSRRRRLDASEPREGRPFPSALAGGTGGAFPRGV